MCSMHWYPLGPLWLLSVYLCAPILCVFNTHFPRPCYLHLLALLFNASQAQPSHSNSNCIFFFFKLLPHNTLYFLVNCRLKMSKRPRSSEIEVALRVDMNRSPTTSSMSMFGGSESGSGSDVSVESSCLSLWDGEVEEDEMIVTRSMMLVGCPGCFMYVMLTDKSSQCPKCKNNVFLDFFNQQKHHA